jgi:serine protease inhibitor
MGIKSIFQPGRRELTGVTAQNLYISDLIHKAGISVSEQGTTASAATGKIIYIKVTPQVKTL